jgi:hypothetical protein
LYFGIVSLISASQEINETQMEPIRKAGIHIEYTNFESNFVIFDVRQKAQTIRTIKHRLNLNQKKRKGKPTFKCRQKFQNSK